MRRPKSLSVKITAVTMTVIAFSASCAQETYVPKVALVDCHAFETAARKIPELPSIAVKAANYRYLTDMAVHWCAAASVQPDPRWPQGPDYADGLLQGQLYYGLSKEERRKGIDKLPTAAQLSSMAQKELCPRWRTVEYRSETSIVVPSEAVYIVCEESAASLAPWISPR